nr:hypothetical protein GCM10017745_47040 [Saccharothrix mutabilis subsp. capreolus]
MATATPGYAAFRANSTTNRSIAAVSNRSRASAGPPGTAPNTSPTTTTNSPRHHVPRCHTALSVPVDVNDAER